jgi:hypothetical protein
MPAGNWRKRNWTGYRKEAAGVELDALCFPQTQMCRASSLIIGCYGYTSEHLNKSVSSINSNQYQNILHQIYPKPEIMRAPEIMTATRVHAKCNERV